MSGLDLFGRTRALLTSLGAADIFSLARWRGADLDSSWVQARVNRGAVVVPASRVRVSNTILLGSDTLIDVAPGAEIVNAGGVNGTLIRTGNAEFDSAQTGIPGVWIYCADEVSAAGRGTLRYTHSTTSLAWRAPGQAAYGAEINVAAVVSAATTVCLTIPAASAGASIYVVVSPHAGRNASISRTVRLEPVTGANAVTWTRDATTRTVSETAHKRRIGDFVILFSSVGCEMYGYISSVTSNTWTISDSAGAGSGIGRAYGVRDIRCYMPGARMDYARGVRSDSDDSIRRFAFVLHAVSDSEVLCPEVWNTSKYALLVTGYKNIRANGLRVFRTDSADTQLNSDGLHILGPGRVCNADGIRLQGGDNAFAIGSGDVHNYVAHLPANGDLSVEDTTVENIYGEASETELVRLYVANSAWIRRTRIRNVSGSVDATTPAAIRVLTDAMSGTMVDAGATNVDGLEIDGCSVVRLGGADLRQVSFTGATINVRNVKLRNVLWRPVGTLATSNVHIDGPVDDVDFDARHGDWDVCGAYLSVTSAGRVRSLKCDHVAVTRANAGATGGNLRPIVIFLEAANAQAENVVIVGGTLIDKSTAGNGACLIRHGGKKSAITVAGFRMTSTTPASRRPDSLIRFDPTAENGSIVTFSGVVNDASFGVVMDGGVPELVTLSGYQQPAGNVLHGAVAAAATLRVGGTHVSASSLLSATLTNIAVEVRNGLVCDGSRAAANEGSLLINTNAAFGTGAGLYYRSAAAWTKVA